MTEAMPFLQKYDITFLRPPTIAQRVLFLQEERHHHAKRNEWHESKAFTVAAFLDFVIDQRKQYAGEESERKTDQSS